MVSTDRALLRLHVEAVWGVRLPAIEQHDCELLPEGLWPSWKLCAAEIADGSVHLWRPGVTTMEREVLRLRMNDALAFPPNATSIPGISREIALSLAASPRLGLDIAQNLARPLTSRDRPLVEAFQPGLLDDYFHSTFFPLVGVVIAGRLLSLAHSSRRTREACELSVDTLPEARRKGYALAATVVWTRAVMQEGLVPIYSALADNGPSLHLAATAGYRSFARIVTLS